MKLTLLCTTFLPILFMPFHVIAQTPPEADLAGTWEHRDAAFGLSVTLVLNADHTGMLDAESISYSLRGDQIVIVQDGESHSYRFELKGSDLILSGGDLERPTTFTRKEAGKGIGAKLKAPASAAQKEAPAPAGLVGTWLAANGAVVEFKPDGTGANARGPFHYTVADGVLVFTSATGSVAMQYEVDGDRLTVTAQGDRAVFTRAQAGAQVQARRPDAAAGRSIIINQTRLTDDQILRLEQQFQVRTVDGTYWYDKACGAWGLQGGPTMGFIPAGLDLGGPLRADASGGNTGVFINGRELHPLDVVALQQITVVTPGRYWVDALGNCGFEGSPLPMVNLTQLAQAARARSGGSYHSRSDITGIGSGGDGKTSYVMGKDWSVIVGD